jgi:hypothetical protein
MEMANLRVPLQYCRSVTWSKSHMLLGTQPVLAPFVPLMIVANVRSHENHMSMYVD